MLKFPNINILVLFKFNDNLFISNHIFYLFISLVASFTSFCKFSPEQNIFVSSENNTIFNNLDMSLIYKINSFGPNTDPWGTPQAMNIGRFSICLLVCTCVLVDL